MYCDLTGQFCASWSTTNRFVEKFVKWSILKQNIWFDEKKAKPVWFSGPKSTLQQNLCVFKNGWDENTQGASLQTFLWSYKTDIKMFISFCTIFAYLILGWYDDNFGWNYCLLFGPIRSLFT